MMDNIFKLNLQMFADAGTTVNTTGTSGLSPGMKTFYKTALLENTKGKYYFAQFGKRQPLPANNGRIIEWRKWNTLGNAGALTEGVIPAGDTLGQTTLTSGINQYGKYVTISDLLDLHHVDNVMLGATDNLSESAAKTQDTLIRNVLMEGTSVIYADTLSNGAYSSTPTGRFGMVATNNRLTPDMVNQAVTFLKKQEAPMINGKYFAIIHPSVVYDLRSSDEWIEAHKYASPQEIFNGEIGELHNVRFIESLQSKVWAGTKLGTTNRYLTCTATYVTNDATATAPDGGVTSVYKLTIAETPTTAHIGRYCHVYDDSATAYVGTVKIVGIDATNKYVWLDSALGITPTTSDKLFPGEGGAEAVAGTTGCAVYATTFFGEDAFGLIDPDGGGLEMIFKSKAEIGGPLEQFQTAGYKFTTGTKILYEERMVRVESCSKYSLKDATN